MIDPNLRSPGGRCRQIVRPAVASAFCTFLIVFVSSGHARADEKESDRHATAAGKLVSAAGSLLRREPTHKTWIAVKADASIAATDDLMALPGGRGAVEVNGGAARLALWGNVPQLSDFPGREAVVALHDNPKADLVFTLERGRVLVTNRKDKGPVRVEVRFQGEGYGIDLNEPGTEVAIEVYGRWLPGVPFVRPAKGKKAEGDGPAPLVTVILLVLKGEASLRTGSEEYLMRATPTPTMFRWNSLNGADRGPRRLTRMPAWREEEGKQHQAARAMIRDAAKHLASQLADARDVTAALARAVDSESAVMRELAVYGLGAVDDLTGLVQALDTERHADVRLAAIDALQHWIGRGPGQDHGLFRYLVARRKYTEGQAEIVLQLLHGFAPAEQDRPDTYESLIAYLQSRRLPVRALAAWYLERWAPDDAKKIHYDPAGPEKDRDREAEQWRHLLTERKLPPRPPATGSR
jgi:hypothetical protein